MTSLLTEQRTAISLLWLKLDHETQPGGRFCFWVMSCSVVGGTPEGESRLMDQALLDTPYSRQWRGCRRGWDGRPIADPSLLSQTHHNHAKSGLVFWGPTHLCHVSCGGALMAQDQKEWEDLSPTPPSHLSMLL